MKRLLTTVIALALALGTLASAGPAAADESEIPTANRLVEEVLLPQMTKQLKLESRTWLKRQLPQQDRAPLAIEKERAETPAASSSKNG